MKHSILLTVAAGAVVLSSTATAQRSNDPRSPGRDVNTTTLDRDRGATLAPRFAEVETLIGAQIYPSLDSNESAELDDIIVDRRDGRAVFVVFDTNGILGSENKQVAVPYGALRWEPARERFLIDITPEQLRSLPATSPKKLVGEDDSSWWESLTGVFGDRDEFRHRYRDNADWYSSAFERRETEMVSGTIIEIDKQYDARGTPYYAVMYNPDEGASRGTTGEGRNPRNMAGGQPQIILLGPASFMQRESRELNPNDRLTADVVRTIDAGGRPVFVARAYEVNGDRVTLRDAQGTPAWTARDVPAASRANYILASNLDDYEVRGLDDDFGDIESALIETNSGRVAYAVVSVGGVLGVGDTLYAVPFESLTFDREDRAFIDMPVEKLKAAPRLSDQGVDALNDRATAQRIDDYFGVRSRSYDMERSRRWSDQSRDRGAGNMPGRDPRNPNVDPGTRPGAPGEPNRDPNRDPNRGGNNPTRGGGGGTGGAGGTGTGGAGGTGGSNR